MAPKKTVALAADNLVRLGAERLAGLLLELAGEQPAVKRRLRFELAGEAGGVRSLIGRSAPISCAILTSRGQRSPSASVSRAQIWLST
jgi:hypothetical protein